MNDRELARFVYENSSEPIIKNPVLRKALQPRLGFYLGKSVPSKGTIEDADTKKAEDALSGVNEVMKVADLQRQGHIGHFYADGGRIGFKNGKNVFLKQGKKSRFTSGAETTVINGKEYLRITKKGDPNFGKYVYRTSIATPGYGRSGKSKNEYLTRDELVKRVSAPKTGKASYIPKKEYTQSLENIKTYVKSQGGPSKVFLSDLVEMFGDSTKTGRDMKTEQRIEKALGDDYKKLISGGQRKKTTQTNKIKFNKLVRDVNRGDKPLINLTQSKTNIAPNQLKQLLNPTELKMYEKLSPKFKAVLSRVIQPRQKYSLDDVKNISETTTKTFNKMTKNYPLSIAARTDIFKSGTRFFNNKSYILGQIARHIGEGGNLYRHVSGNKMSDVKFRNNKTGKLITYRNIDITDPEFKEAATIYDEWDTVKNTKINNPLKSGEKITIAKAMASGGDNLVIDHLDVDGVKGNPLKNLAITNQKANMAGQIIGLTQAEADAIGRGKKFSVEDNIKRYSSYGDKLLKQSAGDSNFKKLTPSETIIKKTGTLKGKEVIQKETANNLNKAGFRCDKANGGVCDNPRAYRKSIQETMEKASKGDNAAVRKIQNLGKTMNKFRGAAKATGWGLLAEVGFAAPFAFLDYAKGANKDEIISNATFGVFGKSIDEQLREQNPGYGQAADLRKAYDKELQMEQDIKDSVGGYRGIAQNTRMLEDVRDATDRALDPFLMPTPHLESGRYFDTYKVEQREKKDADILKEYLDRKKEIEEKRGILLPSTGLEAVELAGGGIASLPGVRQGPAPLSGPLPDGLPFVPNRVTKI